MPVQPPLGRYGLAPEPVGVGLRKGPPITGDEVRMCERDLGHVAPPVRVDSMRWYHFRR